MAEQLKVFNLSSNLDVETSVELLSAGTKKRIVNSIVTPKESNISVSLKQNDVYLAKDVALTQGVPYDLADGHILDTTDTLSVESTYMRQKDVPEVDFYLAKNDNVYFKAISYFEDTTSVSSTVTDLKVNQSINDTASQDSLAASYGNPSYAEAAGSGGLVETFYNNGGKYLVGLSSGGDAANSQGYLSPADGSFNDLNLFGSTWSNNLRTAIAAKYTISEPSYIRYSMTSPSEDNDGFWVIAQYNNVDDYYLVKCEVYHDAEADTWVNLDVFTDIVKLPSGVFGVSDLYSHHNFCSMKVVGNLVYVISCFSSTLFIFNKETEAIIFNNFTTNSILLSNSILADWGTNPGNYPLGAGDTSPFEAYFSSRPLMDIFEYAGIKYMCYTITSSTTEASTSQPLLIIISDIDNIVANNPIYKIIPMAYSTANSSSERTCGAFYTKGKVYATTVDNTQIINITSYNMVTGETTTEISDLLFTDNDDATSYDYGVKVFTNKNKYTYTNTYLPIVDIKIDGVEVS